MTNHLLRTSTHQPSAFKRKNVGTFSKERSFPRILTCGRSNSFHRTLLTFAWLATVFYPASVFAEVSDKEPSANFFWAVGLTAAVLCCLLSRVRPSLGIMISLPVSIWFASFFWEIHSPDISLHLQKEQGLIYFLQAYAAFVIVTFGLAAGYYWHKRHLP